MEKRKEKSSAETGDGRGSVGRLSHRAGDLYRGYTCSNMHTRTMPWHQQEVLLSAFRTLSYCQTDSKLLFCQPVRLTFGKRETPKK